MKLRAVQLLSCGAGWGVMTEDEDVLGAGMEEEDARAIVHRNNAYEGLVDALNAVWSDVTGDGGRLCRECSGLNTHKPDCLVSAALSLSLPPTTAKENQP